MPVFRPVTDDEVPRHQAVADHAFCDDPGPPDYDGRADVDEALAERWGLVEDGALVSVCKLHDLRVSLAGERRTVGGLRGFATPPEHRSQGYGEVLQRETLREFCDRGYPYAVLWPSSVRYYRETGWGLVNLHTTYSFPPEAVRGVGPARAADGGEFEQVAPAEYERLVPAYEGRVAGLELAHHRPAAWWRERVLDDAWTYCWTPDESAEPAGYVVYRFGDGDATLVVDELVFSSEAARRALLGFLARHRSQVDRVEVSAPEETRLLYDATDPDAITVTVEPGPMGRVVDVPTAIEMLPTAGNPEAAVTLAVRDGLLDANDDVFRIEPGTDGPTCERVDDCPNPDTTASIGLLSRLVVGTVSAATASERDELEVGDETAESLRSLFPARDVYFGDFF